MTNAFKIKTSTGGGGEGGDFEVPEADTHYAILVAVIDLGTHTKTYKGAGKPDESTTKRRCALGVVALTDAKRKDGKNHFLAKEYTLSGDRKSALRQAMEACRRSPYPDGVEMDLSAAPGSKWSLVILHQTKEAEGKTKTYAKIDSVGAIKKGASVSPPTVKPFWWLIGCGQPVPDHDWLPRIFGDKIADLIAASPEYMATPAASAPVALPEDAPEQDEEGDIPF